MASGTMTVNVSLTELVEVQILAQAAAELLSALGERGEMRSHDVEPANLNRALDVLHAKIAELRERA